MSTFSGFSEEELNRIKLVETGTKTAPLYISNVKKKNTMNGLTFKMAAPKITKQNSDDTIDNMRFDKCKLTLKTFNSQETNETSNKKITTSESKFENGIMDANKNIIETTNSSNLEQKNDVVRKNSIDTLDIVRGVDNYSEDELAMHKVKLEELQLRQKLMEEQNKKRKEMLAKALADRTKQTAEEVMKLEKIKKELQVLDGQFSQDVAVLRAKIDQACLSYADAEKHYLRVEKEFLQAKIHLQKEREKKELLTEHLCALITHNETRKAQKLETLMLELASDKKYDDGGIEKKSDSNEVGTENKEVGTIEDEAPVIVDGVDQRTGKIVDMTLAS